MDYINPQIIGLFGYGIVGEGLCHVLKNSPATNATIKKICIKDLQKKRSLPATAFTDNPSDILDDPEINLVVELINDDEKAFSIVKEALLKGKSVVSGNKKMIAFHLEELVTLQEQSGSALLYDASACGSIPIIRNLEEYYDNDLLLSVTGILNGSSNFVLSRIFNDSLDYSSSLKLAQQKGFAELDPRLDVEGRDALYKLIILSLHAFGQIVGPEEVFVSGIQNLSHSDIRFAREKGYRIKLVARALKLDAGHFNLLVMPKMVTSASYIYNVENEYNGVVITGAFYEKQFMFGKGAGAYPTGSAVLSDITARMHAYRYEYKKRRYFPVPSFTNDCEIKLYLRFRELIDFNNFTFESIEERYSGPDYNYVIGNIRISNLLKIQKVIYKSDVFLAFFDDEEDNKSADGFVSTLINFKNTRP